MISICMSFINTYMYATCSNMQKTDPEIQYNNHEPASYPPQSSGVSVNRGSKIHEN